MADRQFKTSPKQRAWSRAYGRAYMVLAKRYPEDFHEILEQEKAREGIQRRVPREPVAS